MNKTLVGVVAVVVGAPLVALGVSVSQAAPASAKPDGTGPCSSSCGVGGAGQGGTSSNQTAQGAYAKGPTGPDAGDSEFRSAGTPITGLLALSGETEGSVTGRAHFDEEGNPSHWTGRMTGTDILTGDLDEERDCTGHCDIFTDANNPEPPHNQK